MSYINADGGKNDSYTVTYYDELGNPVIKAGGSLSWRTNNPGNLRPADKNEEERIGEFFRGFSKKDGTENEKDEFAIFPDLETGEKARERLLKDKYGNYESIREMIEGKRDKDGNIIPGTGYAPGSENNVEEYLEAIKKSGLDVEKTKLSTFKEDDWAKLLNAMKKHEGFKEGITLPGDIESLEKVAAALGLDPSKFDSEQQIANEIWKKLKAAKTSDPQMVINLLLNIGSPQGEGKDMFTGLLQFFPNVFTKIRNFFSTATTTRSPIAIDLDNDGVETKSITDEIYFDHDSNGLAEKTGWVGEDDGLLVWDRNGNGLIDNGGELFGDQTILSNGQKANNGFQALADLDDNKDGKINADDTAFNQLRIWRDSDGDGEITYGVDENGQRTTDELYTLDDLGIQSINTGYANTNITDAEGNTIKQAGSFTKSDGTTGSASDVYFQVDNMNTIANEWVDVPDDIAELPDLQGYGNVYDLQQAMVRDTSGTLKGLVDQFASETDADARHSLITQILYKWTGVENVDPLSRAATKIYGNAIGDARKLATLEAFMGEAYVGTWCWGERDPNPHGPASKILLRAFDELSNSIYSQLMAQTHFRDIMSSVSMTWNDDTNQIEWDVSATPEALQALYITNPDNAPLAMSEFADILKLAGDAGMNALEDLRAMGDPTGDGFLQLLSVMGMNTTIGNASNNTLQGTSNNDALYGMGGNDNLYGNAGNDILDGGTGDDYLVGGTGNDSYIFNKGNGQETIFDDDSTAGNTDTIRFGSGILPSDITFTRSGYDLILGVKNTSDQLTIHGWGVMQAYRIERIEFADGTVWDAAQIQTRIPVITGTANDDTLFAWEGDATPPRGLGGNDRIYDEDNQGKIVVFNPDLTERERRPLGNFYKSGENEWKMPDGSKITVSHNSPWKITLPDGSTIELDENFQDGDFGIHLLDTPADPVTTNTITGDQNANNITDTSANDRIETGAGDDTIVADAGGNDEILGGSGRDAISAGYGDDIAEGGSESDIVFGGGGSDEVFGENQGDMETLIANGETATNIDEKGDLVSGNDGNKRQAKGLPAKSVRAGYRRKAIGNDILKLAA